MGRRARSTNGENKFGHSSLSLSLSSNSFLSLWKEKRDENARNSSQTISSLELFLEEETVERKREREKDRSSGKLWNRRLSWVTLSRHVTVSESLPLPRPRRTIGRRGLIQGSLHSSKVLPSRAPIFSRTYIENSTMMRNFLLPL